MTNNVPVLRVINRMRKKMPLINRIMRYRHKGLSHESIGKKVGFTRQRIKMLEAEAYCYADAVVGLYERNGWIISYPD